ncbi:MAG TPA: TadE family protein, partial [Planctomycetaceae bacterium]|nr:TadE family protein [Planctomycetaceae bacterium]
MQILRRPTARHIETRAGRGRRGLAPLELVLSLPVLLFTMALMINIGVVACWKVRAATAARQGIWRNRSGWNAGGDPNPPEWPAPATLGSTGAANLTSVAGPWNQPAIAHPFARGPVITAPGGGNAYIQVRNKRYLEMSEKTSQGTSHIQRSLPLLQTYMRNQGSYNLDVQHPLVDSRWQFQSMGFGWNHQRRSKGWYNFESEPDWASQQARYLAADQKITSNPQQQFLVPLDRDPDFLQYTGNYPDFYPKPGGCQIDPNIVQQQAT